MSHADNIQQHQDILEPTAEEQQRVQESMVLWRPQMLVLALSPMCLLFRTNGSAGSLPIIDENAAWVSTVKMLVSRHASYHRHVLPELTLAPPPLRETRIRTRDITRDSSGGKEDETLPATSCMHTMKMRTIRVTVCFHKENLAHTNIIHTTGSMDQVAMTDSYRCSTFLR